MEVFTNVNEGELYSSLVVFSQVLSMAFMLSTAATLAAGVIASIGNIGNELEIIKTVCANGEDYLQTLEYYMDDNPEYDLLKVDLPFLEFIDEEYRIIQGQGAITAIHTNNGWIV